MEFINLKVENWTDFILLFTVTFNLLIAFIVLLKKFSSISHLAFFLITLFMTAWVFGNFQIDKVTEYETVLFWTKFTGFAVSFFASSYFLFAFTYPKDTFQAIPKSYTYFLLPFSFFWTAISFFTDFIVRSVNLTTFPVSVEYNFLYYPFVLWIAVLFLLATNTLRRKRNQAVGNLQHRISYIIFGMTGLFIAATFTNIILPLFGFAELTRVGAASTILFSLITSYTIIRHQFLDIRFLLGKIIYYSLLAIPPFFMFFGIAYLYQTAFGSVFSLNSYLVGVPVAYMFVGLFTFITGYAKKYTDTRLINPGYDPLEVIDELNRSVSNQLDIETISEKALEIVARTIRPEFQGIFVIPEEGPWLGFTYKDQQQPHPDDFRLIMSVWDERNKGPLNYDELEAKLSGNYTQAPQLMTEVLRVMKMYNLKVIFPLLQQERIAGMLLLGKKEADYPYSIQDTGFLNSIARTISLTVGRALLYEEIQQFNIELQAKVAKATLELKTKNANLEDALRKLEEARRQERDMVDVMGHELRTPLSIVRNAVVVLKEQKDRDGVIPDEKLTKYLNMAAESIRREVGLVETLLTTTKLDSSRIQMDMTKVSLKEVVHDSLLGHQQSAENKNIKIEYDENTPDVLVYADRTRIQEITDNFLSNAIKYTNEGSVKIAISQDDKTGSISITDTGVGISPEDIANLGKKFFRARALYNEDNKYAHPSGTGLGLFVAFELIRIMDGERVITSVPGQGSTFAFKLPLFTGQADKHIDQTFMGEPEVDDSEESAATNPISTPVSAPTPALTSTSTPAPIPASAPIPAPVSVSPEATS